MAKNSKVENHEKHIRLLYVAQSLSFLVVFVGGVILGLASSTHMNRYFTSHSNGRPTGISCVNVVERCPKRNEDCLALENITHPRTRSHPMTDEQIFWRASMMPLRKGYPFRRVPKLAFLFLTRGTLPLRPLWEKFFKGNENHFSIYLHGPPNFVFNVSADSVFYKKEIPSKNVYWGDITLLDAERRLLANALLDFSNERFILLSESCIPIFNFRRIYDYLISSDRSFVESYDDPSRTGRGRYSRRMYPDITLRRWRKGSQWFEVNRELAVYLVSETKYYNLFKKYCKGSCYPDEHYIPTYLNMFHGKLNTNRTVTWVDWSILGPHPGTYHGAQITEALISSIRTNATNCIYNSSYTSMCYLFARKFSPSALEPLLNLSSTLLNL